MKDMQKIVINLPSGDQLVAEEGMSDSHMIAVGVVHDGTWVQDLALIETAYDKDFKYVKDKFHVYVYGDEYSEDYTQKTIIDRIPDDAL